MWLFVWIADLLYDALIVLRNLVSLLRLRPTYVLLELSGPYPEHRARAPWWIRQPPSLEDLRQQLRQITADPRVAGVVVTVRDLTAGFASIQGLRAAFATYRSGGRRVIAYLPQASTRVYYLASVADAVVMPESGTLDLVGLTLEATFLGEAFERIGIVGEFEQIAEYKTAAEPFTRRAMSEPMREALNTILDSVFDDLVGEVASARKIDPAAVRALVNTAPLPAREARDAGLVDAVLFEDELPQYLAAGRRRLPAILPWRLARRSLRRPFRWRRPGRAIAVISVTGVIHVGESRPRRALPLPLLGGETTGNATIARAVRAVERDPRFGAIILSVDSPGGSAVASDLIWRELERAGRRKPVVAFLGNVAGSGGYYVAVGARRIISQPATLTGSIGVVSGKVTVRGLAARAGIHREILGRGEASTIFSPFMPFSPEERRRLRARTVEIYDRFVDRVAAGRRMPREQVLAVARGRVWTGRQAHQHRLIDALGDFTAAVEAAKELMGVPAARSVPVIPIRPPQDVPVVTRGLAMDISTVIGGIAALLEEHVLTLMPWDLRLR